MFFYQISNLYQNTQQSAQFFLATKLSPPTVTTEVPKPKGRRSMENRPSWMTVNANEKLV